MAKKKAQEPLLDWREIAPESLLEGNVAGWTFARDLVRLAHTDPERSATLIHEALQWSFACGLLPGELHKKFAATSLRYYLVDRLIAGARHSGNEAAFQWEIEEQERRHGPIPSKKSALESEAASKACNVVTLSAHRTGTEPART